MPETKALLKEKLDLRKEFEEGLGLIKTEGKATKAKRFERQVALEERIEKYKELKNLAIKNLLISTLRI